MFKPSKVKLGLTGKFGTQNACSGGLPVGKGSKVKKSSSSKPMAGQDLNNVYVPLN